MTLDKINQIFKNNKELEPTLKTYYDEFNKSITYSSDEIFSSEYGFSLGKEYNLLYTKELRVSSSEFSRSKASFCFADFFWKRLNASSFPNQFDFFFPVT